MTKRTPKPKPRTTSTTEATPDVRHRIDKVGEALWRIARPPMFDFDLADAGQVVVGACVLAIPVAFAEESWRLGEELPLANTLAIVLTSISFLAGFIYLQFYRGSLRGHRIEYFKRVAATYLLTATVVTLILILIRKCPWDTEPLVAMKRVIVVAFPASFSATVVDSLR